MILLTGATGFLGGQIAATLLERGHQLRLLVRDQRRLWSVQPSQVELLPGSLDTAAPFAEWLKGIDIVIHAAAVVKVAARWRDFAAVNLDATTAFAAAAQEAGVRRFIYVSTILILQSSVPAPDVSRLMLEVRFLLTAYQRSKAAAVLALRRRKQLGLPVTIVYPGILFGPGPATEGNFIGQLVKDYFAGRAILPQGLSGREPVWSFVPTRAVAEGIAAATDLELPPREYILAGPNITPSAFLAAAGRACDRNGRLRYLPLRTLQFAAAADMLRAYLFRGTPRATPGALRTLASDWEFSSEKAGEDLGYSVPDLKQSLGEWLGTGDSAGSV